MGLDATLAGIAAAVTKAVGRPVTLYLNDGATYDADTRSAAPVRKEVPWSATVGPYDYRSSAGLQQMPRTNAELTLTGSALGLPRAPKPGDEVIIDGVTYQVVHVDPIHAGAGHAAHQVHVKR